MKTFTRAEFVMPAVYDFVYITDTTVEVYYKGDVLPPHIQAIKNPPVDPNYIPPKSLEQEIAALKIEIEKLKAAAPK